MKSSFSGFLVLGLVALAGCGQGTPGGPGADPDAKKPIIGLAKDTFDLSVPILSTALKQGETHESSIGIKRGTNFDQDVSIKFSEIPMGVTIDPANPVIKHGNSEAKFMLRAENEAQLGDFKVKITGHPTKGGDATNEFKLTVAKKDTFTLSVPILSTSLKQGETKEVSIGIKRDKNFDQDVTLTFQDMPMGVTLDPASSLIKNGDTEAKLTFKAANDASLGNFAIKATGHPTKGADATNEFKLAVTKK
jgi:hypothetical protein